MWVRKWIKVRYHLLRVFVRLAMSFLNPWNPLFCDEICISFWNEAKRIAFQDESDPYSDENLEQKVRKLITISQVLPTPKYIF